MIMDETKHKLWGREEILENLAKVCNQMMKADALPEEISMTRLICFNKIALCLGDIDAIRPIGVNGGISKIIKIVVRRRLRKHVYWNKIILAELIGFIQGLKSEVNLVRLREKVEEIIRTRTTSTKFLLFINFKQAYDSVNHYKLFE